MGIYKGRTVAVVVPAYNEERLIVPTLKRAPKYVDWLVAVDDGSTDSTMQKIISYSKKDKRTIVLRHKQNRGLGHAIITGYNYCKKKGYDLVCVVGGDNQMPLEELGNFLDPIVDGKADYTKGNRFLHPSIKIMPMQRLIGNILLSIIERPATGYWTLFDSHDGYTVISKKALKAINWDKAWKKYAYNVDFLARLNVAGMKVMDIPRTAIYVKGERQSQIKVKKYMMMAVPLILNTFFWRMRKKYFSRGQKQEE